MQAGADVPLFTVRSDLPTGENRRRMGTAVWLWLWLTNKQTAEDGEVWYGRPLSPAEIARDLEFDDARNVRRLFARLVAKGYVTLRHTQNGPVVRICHPAKRFRARQAAAPSARTELSAQSGADGTVSAASKPMQDVENKPSEPPSRTELSAVEPAAGPGRTELSAAGTEMTAPDGVSSGERTEMTGAADKNVRAHHKDRARVRKNLPKQPKESIRTAEPLEAGPKRPAEPAPQPKPPARADGLVPAGAGMADIADWVSPERGFFLEVLAAVAPGHDERLPGLIEARARGRDREVRCVDLAALLAVARPDNYRVEGHGFWPVAVCNLMDGDVYAALRAARRAGYSRWSLEGGRTPRIRKALGVVSDFGPNERQQEPTARREAV